MLQNMKTTLLAALMLSTVQAGPSDDGYPPVLPYASVAGWNVLVDMESGPSCYVLGVYGAGTIVRIGTDSSKRAVLVIANPGWKRMVDGRSYRSVISFDGKEAWKGPGRYSHEAGAGTLVFRFADPRFAKGIVDAKSLSLKVEGRDMANVRLSGSREALAAMALCQGDVDAIKQDADGDEEVGAPDAPLRTV
jgi:hypothetical protein